MSQAQNIPIAVSALNAINDGWVAGSELGKSDRHVRRMSKTLQPLGAARKSGRTWYFKKDNPDVAKLLKQARIDRSFEDLSAYTHKQIEDARLKVKIVEAGRREIERRINDCHSGRTVAVEWFCKVRSDQLGFGTLAVNTFRRWDKTYSNAGEFKVLAFIDTRGREPGQRNCSAEAWAHFKALYLDDRKRSIRLCYDLTHTESDQQGWEWPSYRTIAHRVERDITNISRTYYRESEDRFKSDCLPRIRRTYDHVAAGDVWCGDENYMDLYAKLPDGRGGWKGGRPKLTAWLDVRSRMFVGWHIAKSANSDTILASFKKGVREFGPPREVICDNGKDYKAAAGRKKKKSKWDKFDDKHVASVWTELEIKQTWATPYAPQSKMIESHFRAVCNDFCKLFDSYCGNKPENRPDVASKFRPDELPTLEDINERFAEWLEAHHLKPREGEGMYNLSSVQAMEQFRSKNPRQAVSGELLDYICSKFVGPVKVTKDGVRHNGFRYGLGDPALYGHQGEKVWLRIDPERGDIVHVTDLKKQPIATVGSNKLTGLTQEDIRDGARNRKQAKHYARKARETAPFATKYSNESAAIVAMRDRYKAQQQDVRPPDPPDSIKAVRPDLQRAIEQQSKPVQTGFEDSSESILFEDFTEAICGSDDEYLSDETHDEDTIDESEVDEILGGGFMDEPLEGDSDDGDGASTIDAFEEIAKLHERKHA